MFNRDREECGKASVRNEFSAKCKESNEIKHICRKYLSNKTMI